MTKSFYTYLPMKMEQTECSETSAYKIQTPGNYPEENIQQNCFSLRILRNPVKDLVGKTQNFCISYELVVKVVC